MAEGLTGMQRPCFQPAVPSVESPNKRQKASLPQTPKQPSSHALQLSGCERGPDYAHLEWHILRNPSFYFYRIVKQSYALIKKQIYCFYRHTSQRIAKTQTGSQTWKRTPKIPANREGHSKSEVSLSHSGKFCFKINEIQRRVKMQNAHMLT